MSRKRAMPSGIRLTAADAPLVKGMLDRGDRQHDVAAFFGVNGGRIASIARGKAFTDIPPAEPADLPPAGPYLSTKEIIEAKKALDQVFIALVQAESRLRPLFQKPA